MKVDDSFKKPGAVPFKWEIRPGVPKLQNPDNYEFEFKLRKQHQWKHHKVHQMQSPVGSTFPATPSKLKPPPAGLHFQPPLEPPGAQSFRSSSRSRSHRFGLAGLARPEVVSSVGCLPSPRVKRKTVKKRTGDPRSTPEPEYYSDFDVQSSRWSVSTRKSVSPLSSSYQSSPRPVSDADWAAFGLF